MGTYLERAKKWIEDSDFEMEQIESSIERFSVELKKNIEPNIKKDLFDTVLYLNSVLKEMVGDSDITPVGELPKVNYSVVPEVNFNPSSLYVVESVGNIFSKEEKRIVFNQLLNDFKFSHISGTN